MSASHVGRVLLRPFRTYDELAQVEREAQPTIAAGVARLLFVVGATVAVTASGRLAPFELLVAMVSFAYVPFAQFVAFSASVRTVSRTTPLRPAFALYLAGHGPWFVTLLVLATLCFVLPSPGAVLFAVGPPMILLTFGWRSVVTFACLRRGLGLTAARAAVATALNLVVLTAVVVSYYLAMGQLGPQIWR